MSTTVKHVKILADLVEPGETVCPPDSGTPGVVAKINRFRNKLRLTLRVELDDGRSFEINASKFLRRPAGGS